MKKISVVLLALSMIICVTACGKKKNNSEIVDVTELITYETTSEKTTERETTKIETKAPETKAPETKAPETKAPETKAPETEAPKTETPKTEAPKTEAPKTEAPTTEAPKEDKKHAILEIECMDVNMVMVPENIIVYDENGNELTNSITVDAEKYSYDGKVLFTMTGNNQSKHIEIINSKYKYQFVFFDQDPISPPFSRGLLKEVSHRFIGKDSIKIQGEHYNQIGCAPTGAWYYCYTIDKGVLTSEVIDLRAYYGFGW